MVPTNEQIDSVISELKSHDTSHKPGECDFCRFTRNCELAAEAKNFSGIDTFIIERLERSQVIPLIFLAGEAPYFVSMMRSIFWIGFLVGRRQSGISELEKAFGDSE